MSYETLTETEWDQVEKIWDLLDEGELERARLEVDRLLHLRPGHPDLRIVDATVQLEEGEPEHALQTLQGAERSADPAQFFFLRGLACFELARFEAARDDAARALTIHSLYGQAHDLLSRTLEHLGDLEGAREHAGAAHEIDSETFELPLEIADADFDSLVEASLRQLSEPLTKKLDEFPVLVQDLPTRDMITAENPPLSPDLLGLFVGQHLLERSHGDIPDAPGAIFLFRRNLLRACADREELAREVLITVKHELGHLMGLDEDDLEKWGLA